MFTYEIDEQEGILVARHHAGTSAAVESMVSAMARLAKCPGARRQPKVQLLLVDAGARHPGAREREQLAEASRLVSRSSEPSFVFAMVTSSAVARATLAVINLLRGQDSPSRRVFATREEALAWVESLRPGARSHLVRLDARRELSARVDAAASTAAETPMARVAGLR